jgi:hypothetical protein
MEANRQLTRDEYALIRWMIENGMPGADRFLSQLEMVEVTPWHCECGCASVEFQLLGQDAPPPGILPISEFVFGDDENLSGIFVYECNGVLSGLEVYGLSGDAPKSLPSPNELRPFIKNTSPN